MKTLALLILLFGCGYSPESDDLTSAVRAGDVEMTVTLLARGADPNRPSGVNDWTPLMHAVHKNQRATAEALLGHGAAVNRPGPNGMTPLMMAAGYGNDDMVALLLRHHADPRIHAYDGATALDYALTGMSDIDRFTLFRCQDSTVALLLRADSRLHGTATRPSKAFARLKRCTAS